jgi:hypothetical protein
MKGPWRTQVLATGLGSIALLLSNPAWACPSCTGRDGLSLDSAAILAAMISVPFAIAGVVLRIVHRVESERE